MDVLIGDRCTSTITCLLCGGLFLYPGPKYPLHLFTCHGVVEDRHRDYLVKASEYQMAHGELPEITNYHCNHTEDIEMNISDMNDNHRVDVGDSQEDVSVRRVRLTPVKNRDPRLRRAQSTPRRNWNGEDDKSRDPDFALGKGKKSGKVPCDYCGRYYASKDSLGKHQRQVCVGSPRYQPRVRSAGPVTSTPNPYNNNNNDTI